LSANELLGEPGAKLKRPSLMQQLFQMQRVQQIYRAMRSRGLGRVGREREGIERG
jgi:hypothetical protein